MTPKQFVDEVRRLDKLAETVSDANEQLGHLLIANAAALADVVEAASEYAGSISECCMTGERTGEVCELHQALARLGAGQGRVG